MNIFLRSVTQSVTLFLFASLLLLGCNKDEAASTTPDPSDAETVVAPVLSETEQLALGREGYEQYCHSCHGDEAKGDGPSVPLLDTQPPDLTQLDIRFNGVFPEDTIRKMVDGREVLPAHGTREMPIWGNVWTDVDGDPEQEAEVNRRIDALIFYLKSIQAEPEA